MAMAIDRCTLLVTLEEMAMAELDKDEHSTVARGIELAIQAVISEPDIRGLSLNTLRDAIYADAVAHGLFEDFDRIKNPVRKRRALAMRIMEEAAELYAAADDIEHYAEEAADVTLITGDVCGYLGIDWETAVRRKMEINRNRPWKHGKE